MQVHELRKVATRRARILERNAISPEVPADDQPAALFRDRLAGCFHQLTARLRTLVALTFYAELSSEEIASELETTSGNIRVMRHRALAQLHQCLDANERMHA